MPGLKIGGHREPGQAPRGWQNATTEGDAAQRGPVMGGHREQPEWASPSRPQGPREEGGELGEHRKKPAWQAGSSSGRAPRQGGFLQQVKTWQGMRDKYATGDAAAQAAGFVAEKHLPVKVRNKALLAWMAAGTDGMDLCRALHGEGGVPLLDKVAEGFGDKLKSDEKGFYLRLMLVRFDIDRWRGDAGSRALPRMYQLFKMLPPQHVRGNNAFKYLKRTKDSGDAYYQGGVDKKVRLYLDSTQGDETYEAADGDVQVNTFDITTLHEVGHAVDEQMSFMDGKRGDAAFANWRDETEVSVITQILTCMGVPADAVGKMVFARVRQVAFQGADPATMLRRGLRRLNKAGVAHDETLVTQWFEGACDVLECLRADVDPWDHPPAEVSAVAQLLGGRMYHEAYEGRWYSYDPAARGRQVSNYQFRAPGEWFAELYAFRYAGHLDASHQDYGWLEVEVDQAGQAPAP